MNKINMQEFTFVFPVKIDSADRADNVFLTFRHIENIINSNFIFIEQDTKQVPKILAQYMQKLKYINFQSKSQNDDFHKTKLINILVKQADTPFVVLNDVDMVFPVKQYLRAKDLIESNPNLVVLPYTQPMVQIKNHEKKDIHLVYTNERSHFGSSRYNEKAKLNGPPGGCVFFYKKDFISIGGANEGIKNYGPEDLDVIYRFKKFNYDLCRVDGPGYHLDHKINNKSRHRYHEANVLEYNRIHDLRLSELKKEIASWKYF